MVFELRNRQEEKVAQNGSTYIHYVWVVPAIEEGIRAVIYI